MFAVVFGSMLFKCLSNGFDFIIPAISMPVVPFVYYAAAGQMAREAPRFQKPGTACRPFQPQVLTSLAVLALQLQVSEGSFLGGVSSILGTFGRRTFANPELFPGYAESLRANPWSVLWTYIAEDSAIGILGVRFLDVIIAAAVITLLYLLLERCWPGWFSKGAKSHALIAATWLSVLAPMSWFFVFKGQAYVHTHTNYLAWHMPFALFAYALCAWLLEQVLRASGRENGLRAVRGHKALRSSPSSRIGGSTHGTKHRSAGASAPGLGRQLHLWQVSAWLPRPPPAGTQSLRAFRPDRPRTRPCRSCHARTG